ncbi:hypothetical protein GmRootA79_53500 (plasmid) [Acidovorax sp. A79]
MQADDFEVEEVFKEQGDLLVLSLGFASVHDPLDVLHFACGRQHSEQRPPPVEDLLYVERTDQSLACDGREVVALVGHGDHIELVLTAEGARLLQLAQRTRFRFGLHPELLPAALAQLEAMARAGQDGVTVQRVR